MVEAADGEQALKLFQTEGPDLVVLDVNMPRMDGFEVCSRIRSGSTVPILMLTVRGQEEDVVRGLDSGADDYMGKPFSPQTLLARVRALFRRAGMEGTEEDRVDDIHLDIENHLLTIAGNPSVRLTRLGLRLVQLLLARAGHVVCAERLYGHVWGARGEGTENS